MSTEAKAFVDEWASENVQNDPFADGDRYDRHIENLWTACVVSASREGFALPEIEKSLGDLEDYLRAKFEMVFDPSVGLIKD
jgi:hypothetical protein